MPDRSSRKPRFSETIDLHDAVRELLAVEDFNLSGAPRQQLRAKVSEALTRSESVTSAAFDWDVAAAKEDAHRSLYALYADRVWAAPAEPRPEWAQIALGRIRGNLEKGFRHSLARSRKFTPIVAPEAGELAMWFQALAMGEHPYEDGRWAQFVREAIDLEQLKDVVAQRSLFFLREPDPWVYAIASLTGTAKAGLIDLLLDEYGWGKLERMHSTVYAELLRALDMNPEVDGYQDAASWQYIATLNYQWMCALTPEYSRRLIGTIYLTEATSPHAMSNYLAAWDRLGIDDPQVTNFYDLHVTADENHRDVALNEVVVPVCDDDPGAISEITLGIFDSRTLEAEFADHLLEKFTRDMRAASQ